MHRYIFSKRGTSMFHTYSVSRTRIKIFISKKFCIGNLSAWAGIVCTNRISVS